MRNDVMLTSTPEQYNQTSQHFTLRPGLKLRTVIINSHANSMNLTQLNNSQVKHEYNLHTSF